MADNIGVSLSSTAGHSHHNGGAAGQIKPFVMAESTALASSPNRSMQAQRQENAFGRTNLHTQGSNRTGILSNIMMRSGGGGSMEPSSRFFGKDHFLSQPVLSQSSEKQSYLTSRGGILPLNAGQQIMQNQALTMQMQTAREKYGESQSLDRVQKNNFFKNQLIIKQQLQQQQQYQQNLLAAPMTVSGGMPFKPAPIQNPNQLRAMTAGNSSLSPRVSQSPFSNSNLPMIRLKAAVAGGSNTQNEKASSLSSNFREANSLNKHAQAMKIQQQISLAAVQGLNNDFPISITDNSNSELQTARLSQIGVDLNPIGHYSNLYLPPQNSGSPNLVSESIIAGGLLTAASSFEPSMQTAGGGIIFQNISRVQRGDTPEDGNINGNTLATFSNAFNSNEVSKAEASLYQQLNQASIQNSVNSGMINVVTNEDCSMQNSIQGNCGGALSPQQQYLNQNLPGQSKRKKGKTRNNQSKISPPPQHDGSKGTTMQMPTQFTATTITTLPATPITTQNWHTQSEIKKTAYKSSGTRHVEHTLSQQQMALQDSTSLYQPSHQQYRPTSQSPIKPSTLTILTNTNNVQQSPTRKLQFQSQSNNTLSLSNNMINLEEISPEVAAFVVRNYLLPMFEKNLKKSSQLKSGKKGSGIECAGISIDNAGGSSVYNELKLSEKLQLEIYSLREERESFKEHIEALTIKNKELEKKIMELNMTLSKTKSQIEKTRSQKQKAEQESKIVHCELSQVQAQSLEAINLATVSENYRKQFSSKLQIEKVKNEKQENQIIELRYQLSIKDMEADIMGDQLKQLYVAINNLGEGKKQADKKQFELDQVLKGLDNLKFEKEQEDHEYQNTILERDKLRNELKDMTRIMKKNNEDKEKLLSQMKEKIAATEDQLKQATEEAAKFLEEFQKSDKMVKVLQNERDKMRQRIQKLKNRRNYNINQKICKLCGKEYLEKENFNWSCRTHRSEYGGEMWWCCGKTSKDAPGCKFSKHFSKEDEDEDAVEGQGENEQNQNQSHKNKNVRCFCCKEKGHGAKECPRDPNLKTAADVIVEEKRLAKARDFKKLLSDSLGVTSRFFKSLIKRNAGENDFNPFSKGALSFDDYSYKYFNDVVLNPKTIKAINEEDDLELFQNSRQAAAKEGANKNLQQTPENDSNLTLDQVRDFESIKPEAADGVLSPTSGLGDFLPKEVQKYAMSPANAGKPDLSNLGSPRAATDNVQGSSNQVTPFGTIPTQKEVTANPANTDAKRKLSLLTDSSADEDDEAAARQRVAMKPKITQDQIDQIQIKQCIDLFEDINDIKSIVKFDNIIQKPINLIDLNEIVRELHQKSYNKHMKHASQRNLLRNFPNKSSIPGGAGSNQDPSSDWNFGLGGGGGGGPNDWVNDRRGTFRDPRSGKFITDRMIMRGDSMQIAQEIMIESQSSVHLRPIQEYPSGNKQLVGGGSIMNKQGLNYSLSKIEEVKTSRGGDSDFDGNSGGPEESSDRKLIKSQPRAAPHISGSFSAAVEENKIRTSLFSPNKGGPLAAGDNDGQLQNGSESNKIQRSKAIIVDAKRVSNPSHISLSSPQVTAQQMMAPPPETSQPLKTQKKKRITAA